MERTFDKWLLGAGGLVALMLVSVILTYQKVEQLHDDGSWVAHTHEVMDTLEEVTSHLREAEAVERGYLIVGSDATPPDFAANIDTAKQRVQKVKELTVDNQQQQNRIPEVERRIDDLAAAWSRTMKVRREKGFDAAKKIVESGVTRKAMAELQGRLREMYDAERKLLVARQQKNQQTYNSARFIGIPTGVLGFVGVVAFMLLLRRHFAHRIATHRVIAEQGERLRTTLASIGDAVITTDTEGRITGMNAVAESLTGWQHDEAAGRPLEDVFRIVNEQTRQPVQSHVKRALAEGKVVGLANHTVLIAKGGTELPIDDSAAPIRCAKGVIVGCVLVFRDVTARRQAERVARSLAAIVESSDDAIIGEDINGVITSWNGAAERLYGYSSAEAIGQPIAILAPPDQADEIPALLARVKQGERIEPFDTVRRAKNGRLVPISLTLSPIQNRDGQIVGVSKIAKDITVQKRVEQDLRESEIRYRSLVSVLTDVAWTADPTGELLGPQPAFEKFTGTTTEQNRGFGWAKAVHPDDRQRVAELWQRACETRTAYESRGRIWHAGSQSYHYYVARATPVLNADGSIREWVGATTDIHEHKLAEAALREKEAELQLVISRTPLLLFRGSRDLRYVFVNRAAADFLGRPAKELIGPPIAEIIGQEALDTMMPYLQRVLRGESVEFEAEIPYARIGRRVMHAHFTPDRNEPGEVVGWIGTWTDNTERSRLQRERDERAAELAVALGKRTEEARRAEKAEQLLREADRRKDEFLATLAHELRNPLAPLCNALQIIQKSDERQIREQACSMMERQVSQMVRLVDDLLDVSRITQGKLQLRKDQVNLTDVLDAAIETARPIIDASAHELTVTLPPQALHVQADPVRLAQVFSNLLTNAAKYTEKAGHIWLTAERRGAEAVVSVRDTGIGIAPEHLAQIFTMFSQMAPALERSQGGLGIGLSLVKGLVELHGGTIEAKSGGPGKGSEFTVHLPTVDVPVPASEEPGGDQEKAASVPKRRILVVDDLRDAADSLAMMLRMMGHDTRTAYDGLEAVQTAAAFQPNIVLLDIGLPKMNGYEAARHIREQPWGGNVALVALTGWGQEEDKRRSLEAGFDHHLTKPVEAAGLEKLLAGLAPVQNQ